MAAINAIGAEKTICSTLMYNVREMECLLGILQSEHFFDETCKKIYMLASESYIAKKTLTDHSVISAMPTHEEAVLDVSSTPPVSRDTLLALKDIIISSSERRELVVKIDKIKNDIIEGREYDVGILKTGTSSKGVTIRSNIDILERMQYRIDNEVHDHGVGLKNVDYYLNLEPGNLIIVSARPSMGKTGFIAGVMNHLMSHGEGSLFFSLEMPVEAIMLRMLANKSGESINSIRNGRIQNIKKFNDAKQELQRTEMFMMLDDALDEVQIFNIAMAELAKKPWIKNIFIDHLTYIKDSGNSSNNHLRVGGITKMLKRLAKEAKIKVWLLSQLNRQVEQRPNKRPALSDLRESGSIEEDADVVIGLYRDSYYKSREEATKELPVNEVEILILKNRDGEVGGARTMFVGPIVKFTDHVEDRYAATEVVVYDMVDENAGYVPSGEQKFEMPIL